MNGELELDLQDIEFEDFDSIDDGAIRKTISNEKSDIENDVENDASNITQLNENVLSFENNVDLITKVWSHARIQYILIALGIAEAMIVTLLCQFTLQERSDILFPDTVVIAKNHFAEKHFLSVSETGEVFVKPIYQKSSVANKLFSVLPDKKDLLYAYEYKRKIYAIHYKSEANVYLCQQAQGNF